MVFERCRRRSSVTYLVVRGSPSRHCTPFTWLLRLLVRATYETDLSDCRLRVTVFVLWRGDEGTADLVSVHQLPSEVFKGAESVYMTVF